MLNFTFKLDYYKCLKDLFHLTGKDSLISYDRNIVDLTRYIKSLIVVSYLVHSLNQILARYLYIDHLVVFIQTT